MVVDLAHLPAHDMYALVRLDLASERRGKGITIHGQGLARGHARFPGRTEHE
jgi:hypothetical protein